MSRSGSPNRFLPVLTLALIAAGLLAVAPAARTLPVFTALPDFGVPFFYPQLAGPNNFAVATGDLNGDGRADVIVAQTVGVKVAFGDGSGGMSAAIAAGTGAGPNSIAVADLDGDNDLDIVTSNQNGGAGNTFSVLFNNGAGTFAGEATYAVPVNDTIIKVTTGDVTGDSRPEVVVLSGRGCGANSAGCSKVTVWLNNGGVLTAGFSRPYASPTGYYYSQFSAVRVGDVNNDTKQDLILTVNTYDFGGEPQVQIMPGTGGGNFGPTTYHWYPNVGTTNRPAFSTTELEVADVTGDGALDVIAGAQRSWMNASAQVVVMRNDGTGAFATANGSSHTLDYFYGMSVMAGDLNDDGKLDIVGTVWNGPNDGNFTYFLNTGAGNFAPGVSNWTVRGIYAATLADLNGSGNGSLDIVLVKGTNSVFTLLNGISKPVSCDAGSYLSNGTCRLAPAGSYSAGGAATSATPCAAGTYSATAGATACTPAPTGAFVASTGATAASQCAVGSYSSSTGATSCTAAEPGSFVAGAGATGPALCSAGSFSSVPGSASCTLAPAGSFASTSGATEAALCPAGSYSSSVGLVSCTASPAGSYVPNPGATSPTVCAAGYGSNAGAIACFALDTDGDGVKDLADAYPNSNMSATVNVGGCATGVVNRVLENGATFNDLIGMAMTGASNHGAVVSRVSQLTNSWKAVGLISGRDHGAIVSCIARSK